MDNNKIDTYVQQITDLNTDVKGYEVKSILEDVFNDGCIISNDFKKGILDALFNGEKNNQNKSKDYAEGFDFIINEVVNTDRYEDVFVWKHFTEGSNNG